MPDRSYSGPSTRGFAGTDQGKQREIASKDGQSAPAENRSFARDPELAAEARRKGGEGVPPEKGSFSRDAQLAADEGGEATARLNDGKQDEKE